MNMRFCVIRISIEDLYQEPAHPRSVTLPSTMAKLVATVNLFAVAPIQQHRRCPMPHALERAVE